jgi:hypothetical protein
MYNDQDPGNMELAKASPWDYTSNVNNPELEQSEFLRPGETLEDWKPNPFLKPHAEGGRAGYNDGQLVTPNVDGSRPGYGDKYKRFKKSINIDGKEYGVITKPNDPNYGKYVYRGNKGNEYFKEVDDLKLRIEQGGKGKFTGYSKEYLQTLEDIKKHVTNKGGAKKAYLVDLVNEFGDPGEKGRDATTEKRIKKALGDEEYKKLNRSRGGDPRILAEKKLKWNKLVRDVNIGKRPLIDLSSEKRGTKTFIKKYLNPAEKKMYERLLPDVKAIISRVTQPRKVYKGTDAISEISKTTTKNYNKIIKKYPLALEASAGYRPFDAKSSILNTLKKHSDQGGDLFKYISGDNIASIKIRDLNTNKILTYKNLNLDDPMFKEYVDKYDHKMTVNRTKINNPLKKGTKISIFKALEAGGDYMVLDHLDKDGVKGNPLKNLAVSTQKANVAGNIKGLTEAERLVIGRGLNLTLENDIKRYSKYGERILTRSADPKFKVKSPTETLIDYHVGEVEKIDLSTAEGRLLNRQTGTAKVLNKILENNKIRICNDKLSNGKGVVCGATFAERDPNAFMEAVKRNKDAVKIINKPGLVKGALRGVSGWAKKELGPFGWIGSIATIDAAFGLHAYGQGKTPLQALDTTLWFLPKSWLKADEKMFKNVYERAGYTKEDFGEFQKWRELEDLDQQYFSAKEQLEFMKSQVLGKQSEADIAYQKEVDALGAYQNMGWNRPLGTITSEERETGEHPFYGPAVDRYNKIMDKSEKVYKSLKDPEKSWKDLDYSRKLAAMEEANRKKQMTLNKWRGYGFGDKGIEELLTRAGKADSLYSEYVHPIEGPSVSAEQMQAAGFAGGGRAGYMGGGITGIRRPNAVAPDSGPMDQGLRSLYINDKDY